MSLARLSQQLLSPRGAKMGIAEIHEADPAWLAAGSFATHPAFDTSGLWVPSGVIDGQSLKPNFDEKYFDLKTGLPSTAKNSWKIDLEGKVAFNLDEVTATGVQMAAGGAQGVRAYSAAGNTTVALNLAAGSVTGAKLTPSGTPYTLTAAGTGTFTAAPGGGTTATAHLDFDANGQLIVNIINPGKGYLANPTFTPTGDATYSVGNAAALPVITGLVAATTTGFSVADASGLAVGNLIEVQLGAPGATLNFGDANQAYTGLALTYIQTIAGNTLTCYPLLPALPLVTTGTVRRVGGMTYASGTSAIRKKAYRIVYFADDGSQLVTYIPLARSTGKVAFDYQAAAKNMLIPVELMCYGTPIPTNDPWFGTSHPGEPVLAFHYLLDDGGVTNATYQTGLPIVV